MTSVANGHLEGCSGKAQRAVRLCLTSPRAEQELKHHSAGNVVLAQSGCNRGGGGGLQPSVEVESVEGPAARGPWRAVYHSNCCRAQGPPMAPVGCDRGRQAGRTPAGRAETGRE